MSSAAKSSSAVVPTAGSTTARTSSPHSALGTPTTATSATAGCSSSAASVSTGVDVHAARHDDLRLSVTEEQVSLLVEVSDVADGEHPAAAIRCRLLGVVEILELPQSLREIYEPGLPGRAGLTLGVEDRDLDALRRSADAARPLQPLCEVTVVPAPSVAAYVSVMIGPSHSIM